MLIKAASWAQGKGKAEYSAPSASIEFDPGNQILVGQVLDIDDIICFHGGNSASFTAAFHEAVDDYLDACLKLKQAPNET